MSEGLAVLLAVFIALMLLDAPIAFVIGIATVMAAWALGYSDVLISVSRDMTAKLTELATQRFVDNLTSITPNALKGGIGQGDFQALSQGLVVLIEIEEAGAGDLDLADGCIGRQGGD